MFEPGTTPGCPPPTFGASPSSDWPAPASTPSGPGTEPDPLGSTQFAPLAAAAPPELPATPLMLVVSSSTASTPATTLAIARPRRFEALVWRSSTNCARATPETTLPCGPVFAAPRARSTPVPASTESLSFSARPRSSRCFGSARRSRACSRACAPPAPSLSPSSVVAPVIPPSGPRSLIGVPPGRDVPSPPGEGFRAARAPSSPDRPPAPAAPAGPAAPGLSAAGPPAAEGVDPAAGFAAPAEVAPEPFSSLWPDRPTVAASRSSLAESRMLCACAGPRVEPPPDVDEEVCVPLSSGVCGEGAASVGPGAAGRSSDPPPSASTSSPAPDVRSGWWVGAPPGRCALKPLGPVSVAPSATARWSCPSPPAPPRRSAGARPAGPSAGTACAWTWQRPSGLSASRQQPSCAHS